MKTDGQEIAALKVYVRDFLTTHMEPVQPQTDTTGKVALEVWRSPEKRRAVALELGHDAAVTLWLKALNVPRALPADLTPVKARWTGRGWKDDAGKAVNANLFGFEDFHTQTMTRWTVTRIDAARPLLEALLP